MTIHVVQAGETVGSIAESYGVDPARLAADNAVPPSGALAVGQTLVVRFPRQVHAVRAGETLASIAEAYGTTSPPPLAEQLASGRRSSSPARTGPGDLLL